MLETFQNEADTSNFIELNRDLFVLESETMGEGNKTWVSFTYRFFVDKHEVASNCIIATLRNDGRVFAEISHIEYLKCVRCGEKIEFYQICRGVKSIYRDQPIPAPYLCCDCKAKIGELPRIVRTSWSPRVFSLKFGNHGIFGLNINDIRAIHRELSEFLEGGE